MARRIGKFVPVMALALAALVAPVAVPIRFFRERARRKVDTIEPVVPARERDVSPIA